MLLSIVCRYLFGVGHQHSGALNVSVFHQSGTAGFEYVCSSYAIYGETVGKVGDEKGHLVEMTRCLEANGTRTYPGNMYTQSMENLHTMRG